MAIKRISTYTPNRIVSGEVDEFINDLVSRKVVQLKNEAMEPFVKKGGIMDELLSFVAEGNENGFNWREMISKEECVDAAGQKHENYIEFPGGVLINNAGQIRDEAATMAALSVFAVRELNKNISHDQIKKAILKNIEESDPSDYRMLEQKAFDIIKKYMQDNFPFCYDWKGEFIATRAIEAVFYYVVDEIADKNMLGIEQVTRRLSKTDWFQKRSIPEKIACASSFSDIAQKMHKIAKYEEIKAPKIIVANEIRMLMDLYMIILSKNLYFLSEERFSGYYGFNFAGEWVGYYEDEDDDLPPFPSDLPTHDEDGNPIPYFYNEETGTYERVNTI